MKVLTVSTTIDERIQPLLQSAQRYHIPLEILGENKPFINGRQKLFLLEEKLKSLNKNDIVLFVDAWDVLFFRWPRRNQKKISENEQTLHNRV